MAPVSLQRWLACRKSNSGLASDLAKAQGLAAAHSRDRGAAVELEPHPSRRRWRWQAIDYEEHGLVAVCVWWARTWGSPSANRGGSPIAAAAMTAATRALGANRSRAGR